MLQIHAEPQPKFDFRFSIFAAQRVASGGPLLDGSGPIVSKSNTLQTNLAEDTSLAHAYLSKDGHDKNAY